MNRCPVPYPARPLIARFAPLSGENNTLFVRIVMRLVSI